MKTSSYILLPATTFGSAVENYDGIATTFSGIPQKAAAYYFKDKTSQTVSWHTIGLLGVITIEATLDADPDTVNYAVVDTIGSATVPLTEDGVVNIQGKYTWIRATLTDFTSGTISKVHLGY